MDWPVIFAGISGLFWTVTYLLLIRIGFQQKTYGMPMFALGANLSWEFIYTFLFPISTTQDIVNVAWLALDVVIAITFIKFGRKHMPKELAGPLFIPTFVMTILVCFGMHYLIQLTDPKLGDAYSAFGQNLMMSVLFINMLFQRQSSEGQSLYIALFKMIGTIFATLMVYASYPDGGAGVILYMGVIIFIYDMIYYVFLKKMIEKEKQKEN